MVAAAKAVLDLHNSVQFFFFPSSSRSSRTSAITCWSPAPRTGTWLSADISDVPRWSLQQVLGSIPPSLCWFHETQSLCHDSRPPSALTAMVAVGSVLRSWAIVTFMLHGRSWPAAWPHRSRPSCGWWINTPQVEATDKSRRALFVINRQPSITAWELGKGLGVFSEAQPKVRACRETTQNCVGIRGLQRDCQGERRATERICSSGIFLSTELVGASSKAQPKARLRFRTEKRNCIRHSFVKPLI